jgi:hypothetical protein
VSKRAGIAVAAIAIVLLGLFAYGGYRRQVRAQVAARESGLPKAVAPATASASEVEKDIPSGNAPRLGTTRISCSLPMRAGGLLSRHQHVDHAGSILGAANRTGLIPILESHAARIRKLRSRFVKLRTVHPRQRPLRQNAR